MHKRICKIVLILFTFILLFSSIYGMSDKVSASTKKSKSSYDGKLIIVGDSRTRNMSKWVRTNSLETRFVAKSGQGYEWFMNEGADEATGIAEDGDTILVWLGVNDYNNTSLYNKYGKSPWVLYTEAINTLAETDWSDFKVCVAGVGYVDRGRIITYYGTDSRSNIDIVSNKLSINGIKGFNSYLKANLSSKVTWINPVNIIGISSSDNPTSSSIWLKRSNGLYDGLHYNKATTTKIYNYFVSKVLAFNAS